MSEDGSPAAAEKHVPLVNVPNMLTTLRVVLVPVYGWFLLIHHGTSPGWRLAASAVFVVAMVTDKIDGDLARKYDLITNFGKIADPIADKAITGMAFIGLSVLGDVWWWVTVVVLVREWSITFLRLGVVSRVVIAADRLGKLKTLTQALALGGLTWPLWSWGVTGTVLHVLFIVLLVLAVVMTVWSGASFYVQLWRGRAALRRS